MEKLELAKSAFVTVGIMVLTNMLASFFKDLTYLFPKGSYKAGSSVTPHSQCCCKRTVLF